MVGRLFQFLDFKATDFSKVYPDIKPGVGGVWFATWNAFNPSQGQYNVALIRDWLAKESLNKLSDGMPKPLICFLMVHTAPDDKNAEGMDYTPGWLRTVCPSMTLEANGKRAVMPAYTNGFWWQCLADAIKAFAQETDGQAQIAYVAIAHGCDAELWPMKAPWNSILPGGVERIFGLKTVEMMDVYKAAFLQTPVIANSTPGSGRKMFTQMAIARGFGVHMCGAQPAAQNVLGWGNEYGTGNMLLDAVAVGVPAVAETTFGMGDAEFKYWTLLAMLSKHIDAMDVHPDWLVDVPAETWNWATSLMGVTAATSPEAWCVLRDYEYAPIQWTGSNGIKSGQSDWQGNFDFFLSMQPDSNAPRIEAVGPTGAVESRQCRRVFSGYLAIDPEFAAPPYALEIRALAGPGRGTLYVSYTLPNSDDVIEQSIVLEAAADAWTTFTVTIQSRKFALVSAQGAHVHRIMAKPAPEPPPPEEPDWEMMQAMVTEAQAAIVRANVQLGEAHGALLQANASLKGAQGTLEALQAEMAKWADS